MGTLSSSDGAVFKDEGHVEKPRRVSPSAAGPQKCFSWGREQYDLVFCQIMLTFAVPLTVGGSQLFMLNH